MFCHILYVWYHIVNCCKGVKMMWTPGGQTTTNFILFKYWRILGLNNWWISPHTEHRFYASLAPLLAKHNTMINLIMYMIVNDSVLHAV